MKMIKKEDNYTNNRIRGLIYGISVIKESITSLGVDYYINNRIRGLIYSPFVTQESMIGRAIDYAPSLGNHDKNNRTDILLTVIS